MPKAKPAWMFLTFAAVAPAAAQDNAVRSAADAFGERAGIEQSGLYTESQVRGFDLNDSGAYRIDEAYFSRAQGLDDTVLAGVSVRVGVNAARLPYPAPSGVVNYRLREAGQPNELRLGAGFRDFGTPVLQGDLSLRAGPLSLAGGFILRPDWRLARGERGSARNAGAVVGWTIAPGHRLRVFGSVNDRDYDGDYAIIPTEERPRQTSGRCTNIRRTGRGRSARRSTSAFCTAATSTASPSTHRPSAPDSRSTMRTTP